MCPCTFPFPKHHFRLDHEASLPATFGERKSVVVAYFCNFDTLSYLRTQIDDATERNFLVAVLSFVTAEDVDRL